MKARLYRVGRSKIHGRGLFAAEAIRARTRILSYEGERISLDEAYDRYDDERMKRHHTLLLSLGPNRLIDAAVGGNDARFANHSCEPTSALEITRVRAWITALRALAPGDEITIDYSYSTDPSYSKADLRRLYPCRCGAAKCRGTIASLLGRTGRT